jgi:hypothetical protein
MPAFHYAVEILRTNGVRIGQRRIEPDLAPLVEAARLEYLRRHGPVAAADYERPVRIRPVWQDKLGEPYVASLATAINGEEPQRFSSKIFRAQAQEFAAELIENGTLAEEETYAYLVTSFPREGESEPTGNGSRFKLSSLPVNLPLKEGSWDSMLGVHSLGIEDELRISLPRHVLEEAAEQTRARRGIETGGVLIGHLRWDGDLYVEITEQIHAVQAAGESTKLHFTPEDWTQVRQLMEMRKRGELICGWWHSHPVRNWCGKCPEERQRNCPLRNGFLSADDKLLHRTVFPRAFMPALVASDVAYGDVEFAMFGWEGGMLQPRGYHLHGGGRRPEFVRPGRSDVDKKKEEEACAKN